jgi:hypothetical protein
MVTSALLMVDSLQTMRAHIRPAAYWACDSLGEAGMHACWIWSDDLKKLDRRAWAGLGSTHVSHFRVWR